jgi:hypothetical protein
VFPCARRGQAQESKLPAHESFRPPRRLTSPVRPAAIVVTSAPRLTSMLQQCRSEILQHSVRTVEPDGIDTLDFDAAKTFQTFQPQHFPWHL